MMPKKRKDNAIYRSYVLACVEGNNTTDYKVRQIIFIEDIALYFLLPCIVIDFFLNNQTDALITLVNKI